MNEQQRAALQLATARVLSPHTLPETAKLYGLGRVDGAPLRAYWHDAHLWWVSNLEGNDVMPCFNPSSSRIFWFYEHGKGEVA